MGAVVKAFAPCSLEGNRDHLARNKGWGVKGWSKEVVGRRRLLDRGKATGKGLRRGEGPREWRMTEEVTFQRLRGSGNVWHTQPCLIRFCVMNAFRPLQHGSLQTFFLFLFFKHLYWSIIAYNGVLVSAL